MFLFVSWFCDRNPEFNKTDNFYELYSEKLNYEYYIQKSLNVTEIVNFLQV
jgi:hypothetical protein